MDSQIKMIADIFQRFKRKNKLYHDTVVLIQLFNAEATQKHSDSETAVNRSDENVT